MVTWGVSAHHVLDLTSEMYLFFIGFGGALIQGALFGAVYLAFEPHARRAAPHLLIGWARALEGQWRDARVGRELLIGGAGGGLLAVVTLLTNAVPTWIPFEGQTPIQPDMLAVAGGAAGLLFLFRTLVGAIPGALFLFSFYILLRILLRRDRWAIGVFFVIIPFALGPENLVLDLPGMLIGTGIIVWLAARHGPLALFAAQWVANTLALLPLPLVPSAPYFMSSVVTLAALAGLAVLAFRLSRGAGPATGSARGSGRLVQSATN
jgi:hypothetical protein